MEGSGLLARIIEEYGSQEKAKGEEGTQPEVDVAKAKTPSGVPGASEAKKAQAALMQTEERLTGSVASGVYLKYFKFAGGLVLLPAIIALVTAYQGSTGMHFSTSSKRASHWR